MFFNARSLLSAAIFSLLSIDATGLAFPSNSPRDGVVLKPIKDIDQLLSGLPKREAVKLKPIKVLPGSGFSKRDTSNDIVLRAVRDLGELTGHFVKRAVSGNDAFDPTRRAELYWGAYAGDNIITANFTLSTSDDTELILPIENFAQHLKSIKCGTPGQGITMEFPDKETFSYVQGKWKWIDERDLNHFVLVTEQGQCYPEDDRSPYVVKNIVFDDSKLTANVIGEESKWEEVAQQYALHVGHVYVDPATANVTHPQLLRKRDPNTINLDLNFNKQIFSFQKNAKETAGMKLSANAQIQTGGALITDFTVTKGGPSGNATTAVEMSIQPQGVFGQLLLSLQLDGKLRKPFEFELAPTINIPVGGFSIGNLLQIGPIADMGLHFTSSALEGTAAFSAGAKAKLKDTAVAVLSSSDSRKNTVKDWTPNFEKIDPTFTAEVKGGFKAFAELSFKVKAVALGFGYEAGVEAELPFLSANIAAKVDTKAGVCGGKKTAGLEIDCNVGINVHLAAGQPDKTPDFEKDLFHTEFPLYKTCMGFGNDIGASSTTPTPIATPTTTPAGTAGTTTSTAIASTTASSKAIVAPTTSSIATIAPITSSKATVAPTATAKPSSAQVVSTKAAPTKATPTKAAPTKAAPKKAAPKKGGSKKGGR